MTTDDTPAQAGAWLPIPEAAKLLGIHVRTVHRWLDDGKLSKRDVGRGRVEVWCPSHMLPDDTPESTPETPQDTPETAVAVLGQQMAMVERVSQLAREQVAEQMAPLLAALDSRDATIREQAEELGKLRAELTAARRPWWAFWR